MRDQAGRTERVHAPLPLAIPVMANRVFHEEVDEMWETSVQ
jgi:hypothetical protein